MHKTTLSSFCMLATLLLALPALGNPIVYEAVLAPGVPYDGVNMQAPGSDDEPIGANYISFFANAGSTVNVVGDRLAGHYDMSLWVFEGLFSDTSAFGSFFNSGDPGFIAFGDDEDPANIAGPYGDPNVTFNAPSTGFYTVAVTNYDSSADPPNPFRLTATGIQSPPQAIPEPGSVALFGMASAFLLLYAWRQSHKAKAQSPFAYAR